MKTLVRDIRSAFDNAGAITLEAAKRLKYLDAIIHEGYVKTSIHQ